MLVRENEKKDGYSAITISAVQFHGINLVLCSALRTAELVKLVNGTELNWKNGLKSVYSDFKRDSLSKTYLKMTSNYFQDFYVFTILKFNIFFELLLGVLRPFQSKIVGNEGKKG